MRLRVPDGLMPVARRELIGVEACDVAHRQQGRIVGSEPCQSGAEVQRSGIGDGVRTARVREGSGDHLDLGSPSALAQELLDLPDCDRDEPGTELGRATDLAQLLPGHQPGCLHRLIRDGIVTGDGTADPAHVLVVRSDDAAEGDLVTGDRRREEARILPIHRPCHRPHTH